MSDDPRQLSAQAAQALRQGRFREAARLYRALTGIQPDDANHWFNLGWSLRAAREYQPALDAYGEALKRGVARPEDVHVNRSVILSEFLHRMDDAGEELRRAVAVDPQSLAAWLNLGSLSEDMGDAAGARTAYAHALEAGGGSGRAVARLAAIDVQAGRYSEAIDSLRAAAQRPSRAPQDAAEIQFALGNALDAAGDYAAAFEAVTLANRLALAARPSNFRYDPAAQERLVDALIAMPLPQSAAAVADDTAPIFILGMFRSGSTLTEQLLARHPAVTAGGELEYIPAMVREDLQPYPAALASADFAALREQYLRQLRKLFPAADRITDKRPDNFLHVGLIKALFPAARIAHTVRDPLDNVLSVYFLYFADSVTYSSSLDDIVHFTIQHRRLMDHWRAQYGRDIHDVGYDALVTDPRAEMQALVTFCGLEWNDGAAAPDLTGAVRTPSNWQVRQPVHRRSSGRWRNYAQALEPVRERLAQAGLLG